MKITVKQNLELIAEMYEILGHVTPELKLEDETKNAQHIFMELVKKRKILTAEELHELHTKTGYKDAHDLKIEAKLAKQKAAEEAKAAKLAAKEAAEAEKKAAKEAAEAEKQAAKEAAEEESAE